MTKQKTWRDLTIWEKLRRPVKMVWGDDESYNKAIAQWNKEVGIDAGPKTVINVTKNIFALKDKKTGKIIDIDPDEYEVIEKK